MPDYRKTAQALARLTPLQHKVTQESATERPFDNAFNDHHEPGLFEQTELARAVEQGLMLVLAGVGAALLGNFARILFLAFTAATAAFHWLEARAERDAWVDVIRAAINGVSHFLPLSHLELVRNADLFLIAPASANTIAKLAHGLADNLLTSAALAARCPLVVAPAMSEVSYEPVPAVATFSDAR